MKETNNTGLGIAFFVVAALFIILAGGAVTGATMSGGMMGNGYMGGGYMTSGIAGGFSWLWLPAVFTLCVGIIIGAALLARKS